MVNITYPDISVERIKEGYHLDVLCPERTAQKENIALTIKALYFYEAIMRELEKTDDEELKAMNRKTIMTLSYSVIDGLVACLGFKIQNRCYNCKNRCSHYSNSMFSGNAWENEYNSFQHADAFLRKNKIIYLNVEDDKFYKQYRDVRNNVHLTRNVDSILSDPSYGKRHVDYAIKFLNNFIEMLYSNYNIFLNVNRCIQKGGR